MIKELYSTISEKFWKGSSQYDNTQLFQMFIVAVTAQLTALIRLISGILSNTGQAYMLCNAALVLVASLAVICVLNGRKNSFLYILFTFPAFVYAYYISDFINNPADLYSVYKSGLWLIAGAFLIMYFAGSNSKVFSYFLISLLTIGLQMHKSGSLTATFGTQMPIIMHPLLLFGIFFISALLLRNKYIKVNTALSDNLKNINRSISEVVRTSPLPIVELKAHYDDEGNAVNFTVIRVNNSFESAFNINNYEVINQDAAFIFDLAFQDHVDIYKLLLYNNKKIQELHFKKLEKWYKVHTLHPNHEIFYLILEDITKIKRKLGDLEISRKRYKVLLEAIPDMFFVIGKDGTYEDFVIKESDLFKVEDANIVGSTIFDVGFPENMAEKIFRCIQNCLTNNSVETVEYSLKTPNGTYLFEMRLAKLNARSVISVARDITRRKNAEFSLEKAKKKAEESDRLKSVFLTNLSHEIRTPLHIITNFTRMLTEGGLKNSEKNELSEAIIQNGKQLMNMINNTIHLSKIETETIEVSNKFCNINSLIKNIYNHYKTLIPESRPVKFQIYLDVPNPAFGFKTDSSLLKETLELLIDNAIKYTLKGEIWIKYEIEKNEQVKFTVSDTGIGIQAEEINNIFSRFYRVKNEINDVTSGSGIGLPIAKQFIKLLGGELIINTEPNKGTTITFLLPFREGEGYLRVVS